MNERKICFIMCVNSLEYEAEQIKYLQALRVPEGYEMEVLSIWDAISMTAGYNEAMGASDAKYKVYLHQDVFIIERDFIEKILRIFKIKEIGLIGMVGVVCFPENAIMWYGGRVGNLYGNMRYKTQKSKLRTVHEEYCTVEAVDGLLMATQYDLPWREDLFDGWDFYDVSQSREFLKAGYQVVVPRQEKPWCLHDDGFLNLKNYYRYREKFLREYC